MGEARGFRIGPCLGRGGFGEVYRAAMVAPNGLETDVAIKVLRRDLDPGGQAVQRLRDEGRMMARLRHPAILRVLDLVVLDGRVALVTEYIDGEDLAGVFEDGGIPRRPLLECVAAMAGALDAAFNEPIEDGRTLGLVHRDIKPANIRISRHGEVRVLDFGIARTDSMTREARTATDMLVGSPPYMAPERFLDADVRLASDVFAIGATLFEGIVGRRFFLDQNVTMLAGISVDPTRYGLFARKQLAALPADLEPEVRALVEACVAYDPDSRPSPAQIAAIAEGLADRMPGPTLARWARDRTWRTPAVIEGELENRWIPLTVAAAGEAAQGRSERAPVDPSHVTVGLPAPAPAHGSPLAPPPTPIATRRPRTPLLAVVGGVGVLGVLGVALLGAVVGGAWWWTRPAPPPTVAVVEQPARPDPVPEIVPEPVPVPVPVPETVPVPAPVVVPVRDPGRPRPQPVVEAPAPPPAPPAPTPAPDPASPAAAPATVRVTGDVLAELRGPRSVTLPQEGVAPGSYTLWVRFDPRAPPESAVKVRSLEVAAGGTYTVACQSRFLTCSVRE